MRKIFGVALIVIGVIVAVGSFGSNQFSSKSAMGTARLDKIDLSKYEEVIFKSEACDLNVYTTENSYMDLTIDKGENNYHVTTTDKGKALIIEVKSRKKLNLFNFSSKKATLTLPKEFNQSLSINQHAGDITFKDTLDLHTLVVSTKAGNIKNLSGNFELINLESFAGDVYGYQVNTNETRIKSHAGDITLEQFNGSLFGSTSAGDLKVEYVDENGDVEWMSKAGDIKLTIPEPNFVIETSSNLGKVDIDFPVTNTNGNSIVGNGEKILKLSVIAGDIEIE